MQTHGQVQCCWSEEPRTILLHDPLRYERLTAALLGVAKCLSAAWITASARVLQGSAARLPLDVQANIEGGELLIGSLKVPLPISGTGQFSVMYVDPDIRVFSDPQRGTVSVQMKASRLEQLLN